MIELRPTRLAAIATLWLAASLMLSTAPPISAQQKPAPASAATLADGLFVVSHVDLLPDSLVTAKPALLQYVADSRKDPGALRIELLEQTDRPNHFTIVSVWASEKAFTAHLAAAHTRDFRTKLQSALGSPFDERLHHLAQ